MNTNNEQKIKGIPWNLIDRKYICAVVGKDKRIYLAEYIPDYSEDDGEWEGIKHLDQINISGTNSNDILPSESLTKRPECDNHEWIRPYFIDDEGHEFQACGEYCIKCSKLAGENQKYEKVSSIHYRISVLHDELRTTLVEARSCLEYFDLFRANVKELEKIAEKMDRITDL